MIVIFKIGTLNKRIQVGQEHILCFQTLVLNHNLDSINISKFRTALTRFRVSSHRLAVETGRWHKPQPIEINERKCLLCNSLEDEFHFIFECPLYSELRQKYIKKYYWKKPCIPKFIDL